MLDDLNKRFTYRSDPRWDSWSFMSTTDPQIFGDCEDYSLYVAKELLSGGSVKSFWFNLWIREFDLLFVNTKKGGGHCVLVCGDKAIDNWSKQWITLAEMKKLHNFKYRCRFPLVLAKLLL
jgi:predicted transglutaminase-like cysteine proteinase